MSRYAKDLETGEGVGMKKTLNLAVDIIYCVFLFWTISVVCIETSLYIACVYFDCVQPHICMYKTLVVFWFFREGYKNVKMQR